MLKDNKQKFPLNIQLFAEDNGDGGNNDGNGANNNGANNDPTPPKNKYSDEEYIKLKAQFDKLASEQADLKKQLKSKQTDEEKKAEEEANRQKEMEDLKKEVSTYKIKSVLAENFDQTEVEKIVEAINGNDVDKLVNVLKDIRKEFKEKVYADAKKEFSQSARIPGGNGNNNNDIPSDVQDIIDKKNNASSKNARDYYFGNKK